MRYYSEDVVDRIIDDAIQYGIDIDAGDTERPFASHYPNINSNWHTGTPTKMCLYVVLTEGTTIGVHSSKGTYILDFWDGYCFKNLKAIVENSPIQRNNEYSWVAWQKIEPYRG